MLIVCVLFMGLGAGCDAPAAGLPKASPSVLFATAIPTLAPTPEVDMVHAHEALESGGELTYDEMVALKLDIVGNIADINKIKNSAQREKAQHMYDTRSQAFSAKLEKCALKETIGWVMGWYDEFDSHHNTVPDEYRLGLYMSNPFQGKGKEVTGASDLYLIDLTSDQIPNYKVGQRIKFSGTPLAVDAHELSDPFRSYDEWSVKDATFNLLDDDPPVPTPTSDQLKDMHITLERSGCFGVCPYYVLTIEPDGKLTFDGRYNTAITGTVTSTIGQDKLIELATEINKTDFFSLSDDYPRQDDVPVYLLTIQMNGMNKQVTASSVGGPRRLYILMSRIDAIVDSYQWVYGNK
jgi:hypothetical protein